VDRDPWPGVFDRDLDVPDRRPTVPAEPIDRYRRLVANPLLAVFVGLLAAMIIRAKVRNAELGGFFLGAGLLLSSFLFIQFHCLDCGVTGSVWKHRRHTCPHAVARWHASRPGLLRMPPIGIQIAFWVILLISGGILFLILFALSV
jgi:hypothetical protein